MATETRHGLAVAVVMDGIADFGGQHGQAEAIAAGMARRGHRVCYVSRWPVSRRLERVERLLAAGVDIRTPRWHDSRRRLLPGTDVRVRASRLLRTAWQNGTLPRRALLATRELQEGVADDFAEIAVRQLQTWQRLSAHDRPLVIHVVARYTASYLPRLRALGVPIVFSEFGRLALYELDVDTAGRVDADACTTDSPDSAAELETVEEQPVSVIPCIAGSEDPATSPGDAARRFVVVNRLVDYKQTEIALEAAAAGGYELDVYGDGPDEEALRALAAGLGDNGSLRLHGMANAANVRAGLDAADAFVSCSRLDGTPMAVLEAMSRARPVVAYPLPGITSIVGDESEGLHFDGSVQGLIAAMNRLAREQGLGAALGRAARSRWERELAPGILLSRYEEIYRQLLDG